MIQRNVRSEQILSEVMKLLRSGYSRGDRIPTEKELAERLGVGRNSIREVMKMLNLAGMTESIAGKGTFLLVEPSRLTDKSDTLLDAVHGVTLQELLEVRRMLETESAMLAAKRYGNDPEGMAELKDCLAKLEAALDAGQTDVSREGTDFHMALVRLSGNRVLQRMLRPVVEDFYLSRKLIPVDLSSAETEKQLHRAIVSSVESGDPELAKAAVLAHFAHTAAYY